MDNKSFISGNTENLIQENFTMEGQRLTPLDKSKMKKCPYCAEFIQPEAIKCRFCGEFLHGFQRHDIKPQARKWYYSTTGLIILFLVTGPFAIFSLPVIWKNPYYNKSSKITWTVILSAYTIVNICITIITIKFAMKYVSQLMTQFDNLSY